MRSWYSLYEVESLKHAKIGCGRRFGSGENGCSEHKTFLVTLAVNVDSGSQGSQTALPDHWLGWASALFFLNKVQTHEKNRASAIL